MAFGGEEGVSQDGQQDDGGDVLNEGRARGDMTGTPFHFINTLKPACSK